LEDRWILARLDSTIRACRAAVDAFDFGAMAQQLYRFVWDEYCSWALELSKTRLSSVDDVARRGALRVMGSVLADMLRLLHPVIPFVTEELWSRLRPAMHSLGLWMEPGNTSELLVRERYPKPRKAADRDIEERFSIVQRFVAAVRQLRAASDIKDSLKITVQVKPLDPRTEEMLERLKAPVCFLARLDRFEFAKDRKKGMAAQYDAAFELYIELAKYLDLEVEMKRIDKEIAQAEREIESAESTLKNASFVERAPPDKVAEKRAQAESARARLSKLQGTRAELAEVQRGTPA
jgi:valyl-tRNA synthetase